MTVNDEIFYATPEQRIKDCAFLDRVKRDYVTPLLGELEEAIPGYSDMSEEERFYSLVRFNQFGNGKTEGVLLLGDSLVLDFDSYGNTDLWAVVYSGKVAYDGPIYKRGLEFYRPAFIDNQISGMSVPQRIRTKDPFHFNVDIGTYLRECPNRYKALHPSYRVALLAKYVCENIVCLPADAAKWCAGCFDELKPRRFIADNVATENGQLAGWWFRVRDGFIPVEFGKAVIAQCREATELFQHMPYRMIDGEHDTALDDTQKEQPAKRAGHQKTNDKVAFVDSWIERGEKDEPKFWARCLKAYKEEYPENVTENTTPKTFADSYYTAKKRREGR